MVWEQYVFGKQTYSQLASKYRVSRRTIQRWIDAVEQSKSHPKDNRAIILLTDTTYFGRGFGVMVFRDYERSKNIYWRYVRHETLEDYLEGVKIIQEQGYKIKSVVCDGKRGLLKSFGNIPVQMCQFHQVAIVTRYITKRSKIKAHRTLLDVVYLMARTDKESFIGVLNDWYHQWSDYMNEKVYDEQKKKYRYKHHRLRSAYRSLITNLPFLFTWYDHYDLKIPNTTNSLEGVFTDLKNKIRVHAGLKKHRKQKLIDALLSR